jgi:ferritin-like protein
MAASTTLHEDAEKLAVKTIELHRAIVSLMEELEAIDWYNQRADVCKDPQLKAILEHNRDEEIEHASMALEWIRRNSPKFNEALKTYLFTSGEITLIEKEATGDGPARNA